MFKTTVYYLSRARVHPLHRPSAPVPTPWRIVLYRLPPAPTKTIIIVHLCSISNLQVRVSPKVRRLHINLGVAGRALESQGTLAVEVLVAIGVHFALGAILARVLLTQCVYLQTKIQQLCSCICMMCCIELPPDTEFQRSYSCTGRGSRRVSWRQAHTHPRQQSGTTISWMAVCEPDYGRPPLHRQFHHSPPPPPPACPGLAPGGRTPRLSPSS